MFPLHFRHQSLAQEEAGNRPMNRGWLKIHVLCDVDTGEVIAYGSGRIPQPSGLGVSYQTEYGRPGLVFFIRGWIFVIYFMIYGCIFVIIVW